MGTVESIPVWKRGATPQERLLELAQFAAENPGMFEKFVILYMQDEEGTFCVRSMRHNCSLVEGMGIISVASFDIANGGSGHHAP